MMVIFLIYYIIYNEIIFISFKKKNKKKTLRHSFLFNHLKNKKQSLKKISKIQIFHRKKKKKKNTKKNGFF